MMQFGTQHSENAFKAARLAAGLTQEELAERAGVSRITVNRIERRGVLTHKQAELYAPLLNVDPRTLILGAVPSDHYESRPGAITTVPVIGEVAAGIWLEVDVFDEPRFEPVPAVLDDRYPAESQFALIVRGPSINKTAEDGAILLCVSLDSGLTINDGDLVIVERTRAQGAMVETTAKFVRRLKDGYELWPHSTDPRYQEPIFISEDGTDGDVSIGIKARVLSINSAPKSPWS
ncbi:MAG: helix-turn-helix domain-containing protein [Pseudomonadota bacterium]